MTFLAFDQAARISGWSYWEDGLPRKWGTIESPGKYSGGQRLHYLREKFKAKIEEFNPDMILIENPVGGEEDKYSGPENNWKTMQTLCQVQGVLLEVIHECGKEVEIISPSSWQNTCGIHKRNRTERKEGACRFVQSTYGLSDIIQDIVDSICIGYHYVRVNGLERSAF